MHLCSETLPCTVESSNDSIVKLKNAGIFFEMPFWVKVVLKLKGCAEWQIDP